QHKADTELDHLSQYRVSTPVRQVRAGEIYRLSDRQVQVAAHHRLLGPGQPGFLYYWRDLLC
ncbi:unnamed protein product, partial [Candidula unifasciata]